MKRTPITPDLLTIPKEFHPLLAGSAVYDSSCSRIARVYYIDRDGGYYLKASPKSSLAREAELTRFYHKKGLAAAVLTYLSTEKDWLLTTRVAGEDCTHAEYLAHPERLCDTIAEQLRLLHDMDTAGCPVNRTAEYLATVDAGYAAGKFHPSFYRTDYGDISAAAAYGLVKEHSHLLKSDTLLHGDYCLPNIMLENWNFSGFIDLDGGGMGDRHIDLFWGAWSLRYNLKTDRYRDRFFDAYGRANVDMDMLKTIAAAETFG